MKHLGVLFAALALAPSTTLAQATATATPVAQDAIPQRLADYMKARRELGHFNGTVLVVQNGRTLISQGVGWANFEHRVPASATTRYAVASITKQFTAAAILQLRDQGKLGLDDPLCRYVAPCPASWAPVRIRHLLNHSSGVLDYEEPRGLGDPKYIAFVTLPDHVETAIKEAEAAPLEFAPGSKFHYSNTGYILLSRIVAKVSGQTYADYVEGHLLRPAGMTDSMIFRRQVIPNMARGYRLTKLSLRGIARGQDLSDPTLVEPIVLGDFSGDHGDANLITTAPDLAKWAQALMGGKIVSQRSLREMTTPVFDGYGFGLDMDERFGTRRISHSGGLAGFISWLEIYPDKNTTVVTLSNFDNTLLDEVSRDLAAIALGQPYTVPKRHPIIELPAATTAQWVGDYALPGGKATVQPNANGFLEIQSPRGKMGPLLPISATQFYLSRVGQELVEGMVAFRAAPGRKTEMRITYRDTVLRGERQ